MKFTLRHSKITSPLPVVQPEADVENAPSVPTSKSPQPYSKLEMHWTVVEGKLVCEWRQNPD